MELKIHAVGGEVLFRLRVAACKVIIRGNRCGLVLC